MFPFVNKAWVVFKSYPMIAAKDPHGCAEDFHRQGMFCQIFSLDDPNPSYQTHRAGIALSTSGIRPEPLSSSLSA